MEGNVIFKLRIIVNGQVETLRLAYVTSCTVIYYVPAPTVTTNSRDVYMNN